MLSQSVTKLIIQFLLQLTCETCCTVLKMFSLVCTCVLDYVIMCIDNLNIRSNTNDNIYRKIIETEQTTGNHHRIKIFQVLR